MLVKNLKKTECSETQEYTKKYSENICVVFMYYSITTRYYKIIRFMAFSFQKHTLLYTKKKYILAYMSVKALEGGGTKGLENWKQFFHRFNIFYLEGVKKIIDHCFYRHRHPDFNVKNTQHTLKNLLIYST